MIITTSRKVSLIATTRRTVWSMHSGVRCIMDEKGGPSSTFVDECKRRPRPGEKLRVNANAVFYTVSPYSQYDSQHTHRHIKTEIIF